MKKNILLFSTLNPYPFWAGSENLWFDLVNDERTDEFFNFHLCLANSPVTKKNVATIRKAGVSSSFYNHFNVNFFQRNIYRVLDRAKGSAVRTLPWYDRISNDLFDFVFFNVAALADLKDLRYATDLCNKHKKPYWLLLQHGYEDFFLTSREEVETVTQVVEGAAKMVFVSKRNRASLERAITKKLSNALGTVNALPGAKHSAGARISAEHKITPDGIARFFNLGRFSPQDKAQHLLLESLAGQEWKQREWELNFIGVSGFGKYYLERLMAFYGIETSRIRINEHTENVFGAIASNDVLLMPSLSEGMPFAMIEAMTCGRPAVGTPVAGIPELIIEGETGWLSRTVHVNDVADAINKCWNERNQWAAIGEKAQKHVSANFNEQYTFEQLINELKTDSGV